MKRKIIFLIFFSLLKLAKGCEYHPNKTVEQIVKGINFDQELIRVIGSHYGKKFDDMSVKERLKVYCDYKKDKDNGYIRDLNDYLYNEYIESLPEALRDPFNNPDIEMLTHAENKRRMESHSIKNKIRYGF